MRVSFSKEELQPLKELLFGLQKQASVQLSATVGIIAQELIERAGVKSFAGSDLVNKIKAYLQGCIDGDIQPKEDALRLLIGDQSYEVYKQPGPKVVYWDYPSPESPKCIFRITPLNSEPEVGVKHEATAGDIPQKLNIPERKKSDEVTLYDRACEIRDKILSTAPASVKEAIPNDDWAVAMYCAPYFYGVK